MGISLSDVGDGWETVNDVNMEEMEMKIMMSLGWAGTMLLVGVLLRAKVPAFRRMLVPASVLAGLAGVVVMNLGIDVGADSGAYTQIVNELFTISFISIGLTDASPEEGGKSKAKGIAKGTFGMGLVWCILYALTPLIGFGIVKGLGSACDMNEIYGTMIPFAFTQGPGQAASFGVMYEGYGWKNAAMVGVSFAAMGFLASFLVGVPLAKLGINRRLARNVGQLEPKIARGYYREQEQIDYMGKDTMYSGNLETLSFHFALIALCYILAVGLSKVFALIPGFFGGAMSGMMFMNGMLTSNVVRWLLHKLGLDFLKDSTLQRKLTGWTSDFLVVCSFMAVEFRVIGQWIVPMLVEAIVVTIITVAVCLYFGRRFGGENDFERTLGLYGTSTGTVPSGIALVRIVDPALHTTTAVELGLMNYVMLFCTPVYFVLLGAAAGSISEGMMMGILAALVVVYLILLKIFRAWNKPTYSFSVADDGKTDKREVEQE